MRSYAPAVETLQWQTLTPQHMPPIGENFLLWRGVNDEGGGALTLGRRQRNPWMMPCIDFVWEVERQSGKGFLVPEKEYGNYRWAAITPPKCVIRKRIKEKQRMMEMEERMVKNG